MFAAKSSIPIPKHPGPPPLVRVGGSHFEMGKQIGQACASQISHSIEDARKLLEIAYNNLELTWEGARIQARMDVACARGQLTVKTREIERNVACGVELYFMTGYMQVRRLRDGVAYGLAQAEEGLTQIMARGLLGFIGQEESDERIAAMRTIRFDRKIHEERAGLVRWKLGS